MAAKQCQPEQRVHVFEDDAQTCACGQEKQAGGSIVYSPGLQQPRLPLEMLEGGAWPKPSSLVEVVQDPPPPDKIKPKHYDGDDCMKLISCCGWGPEFCLGQAVKYLWRAGRKSGESAADDVGKARWYLDWMREHVGTKSPEQIEALELLTTLCKNADKGMAGVLPLLLERVVTGKY